MDQIIKKSIIILLFLFIVQVIVVDSLNVTVAYSNQINMQNNESRGVVVSTWSDHGSYSDYNKYKFESFNSNTNEDASKTTVNWANGKVELGPSIGASYNYSYETIDRSSGLNNFAGPVTTFSNDNIFPIIGGRNLSLNIPIINTENSKGQDISDKLINFSGTEIKTMALSYCGDVYSYAQEANKDLDDNSTIAQIGNDDVHAYLLVGGDNSDKNLSNKIVRLNKLKAISYTKEGIVNIESDDLSSEILKFGFQTINDISCSETECLIIGGKGKLVSYNGKSFVDLSNKIDFNTLDDSKIGWNGEHWLIAGTIYSSQSSKYIGVIYKYQDSIFSKITTDEMFISSRAGAFNMSLNKYLNKWLIIKGGSPINIYTYDGNKFDDFSAKIDKFYSSSELFAPDVHRAGKVWFIINKGTSGHVLRFDGENMVDVEDALNISVPIHVIGSASLFYDLGNMFMIGGGTQNSPKLYEVTESSLTKPSSYNTFGVAQSGKINTNTKNILNAYIVVGHQIPSGTSIKYYITNDGGNKWEEVSVSSSGTSMKFTFGNTGNDLRWKAVLTTNDKKVSSSIDHFSIYYTEEDVPEIILQNGDLVKGENDSKIFVIVFGKKKWVRSAEEFQEKGYIWSNIKVVSSEIINKYSDYIEIGRRTDILKSYDQSRVYRIINGKRLWIPTISVFNAQGLKWDEINNVSSPELEKYPRLKLIKAKGDDRIFYVTNSGMKKHILTGEVFSSYNNKYQDVVEVDTQVIDSLETVDLIKDSKGHRVYKIEGNQKRWIRSAEAFNRNNFDWNKIAPSNDTDINSYIDAGVIE
ncbi:hypothetical protein KAS31_01660 [Candidatus Parcubacteria bacterium]|nr:hypothetical protein [Candidatus Parcubacteria bacterium]